MLSELFKGSGDPNSTSSFRGILVSDGAGKALHGWHRSQLLPHLVATARPNMCGGVPGMGTDLCAHLGRSAWQYAASRSLSCAVLFVDVVGAFDAVLRQVLWQGPSDLDVARLFSRMGFPPEAMHELARTAAAPGFLGQVGVPAQVVRDTRQSHVCSWFSTQGVDQVACSQAGSKPGDPLGDIVFNCVSLKLLNEIEASLDAQGLLHHFPCEETEFTEGLGFTEPCKLCETNYVDDSLFVQLSPDAHSLIPRLSALACTVQSAFHRHAMKLNWKAGKSEAMVAFHGPHSKKAAIDFHIDEASLIFLGKDTLRAVSYYKHMGTQSQACRTQHAEIKHRSASMFAQYRPLRRSVFAHTDWPLNARIMAVSGLLHSRLLYNAGIWDSLSLALIAKVRRAYMAPIRDATGMQLKDGQSNYTNHQVAVQAGIPILEARLALDKLRYFLRFSRLASPQLLRVVLLPGPSPRSWLSEVCCLLGLLANTVPELVGLPPPDCSIGPWILHVREHPKWWYRLIRRSCLKDDIRIQLNEPVIRATGVWQCDVCSKAFPTCQALHSHESAIHHKRNPVAMRVQSTACLCCGVQHHSRKRILHHVMYRSPRCRQFYLDSVPPLEPSEFDAVELAARLTVASADPKAIRKPAVSSGYVLPAPA